MCQLTLISVKNDINRMLLFNQLNINSNVTHRDGTGFYQRESSIFKSKICSSEIENLDEIILTTIKNLNPIIGHVRFTSTKSSVKDENSHPFETDKLVLAHNGTLTLKSYKDKDKYGDKIDSEQFLQELDAVYNGKNMVSALNKAMSYFYGPFAFLIFSKLEDKYFVVRGKTKKLHFVDFELDGQKGFTINTEKESLESAITLNRSMCSFFGHNIKYEEIKLLDEEKIYVLDEKKNILKEIGVIKENENTRPIEVTRSYNYDGERYITYSVNQGNLRKVLDNMFDTGLTLPEFDNVIYHIFGFGIAYLSDTDYDDILKNVIPALMSYYSDSKKHIWIEIRKLLPAANSVTILNTYDLEFPYYLNRKSALVKTLNIIKNNQKLLTGAKNK